MLNADERALFGALADVLIPAGEGMPSASEAGVAGKWLDEVLEARPDLAEGLRDVLKKAAGREPRAVVEELRKGGAPAFGALAEIVPGAYFMNPSVREAIGYVGQDTRPIDPRPDYLDDGLLGSVISRGPIYRPTPGSG
jgi:hypothetical protein